MSVAPKSAHSAGPTTVIYDKHSEKILTAGSDGSVKVWDEVEDEEATQVFKLGGNITCLTLLGDDFYCPTDKGNSLQSYSISEGQCNGLVTRFPAPITDLCSSNSHIAAACSDFSIKVINKEHDTVTVSGHTAPVLSVALSNHGYLASSSGDQTVRIWKAKTKCCLHTFKILTKCNDMSLCESLAKSSWKSDSTLLAVPVSSEVHIYNRESGELTNTLTDPSLTKSLNICSYSPDDKLLAVGSTDGRLIVWEASDWTINHRSELSRGCITSLCWVSASQILYSDDQGQFGSVDVMSITTKEKEVTPAEIGDLFDADDDFADDLDGEEFKDIVEEHEEEVKATRKKAQKMESDDESDTEMSVADSEITTATDKQEVKTEAPPRDVTRITPQPLQTDEQEAFQPGSTDCDLPSRYMVWNSVGMIRSYASEEDSTVDIEFHDAAVHHAIHLSNTENYIMADIGETAILLGSRENSQRRSCLLCINHTANDDNQQWTLTLDKYEVIQCLCVGGDYVAVVTSANMVRTFSPAGVQLDPFMLPGAPVAMVGYKNVLMIVYHSAPALDGQQHLSVIIMTIGLEREFLVNGSRLPITPGSTLTWIGFSSEGTPCSYDSTGLLTMYRIHGAVWTPVANTKSTTKDHHPPFLVSVSESPGQILCVAKKGRGHPVTAPRPPLMKLDFQIQLSRLDMETSAQEELVWRSKLFTRAASNWLCDKMGDESEYEKQERTALLKLFSIACREERLEKAYQICQLMPDSLLKVATQYAHRTSYVSLAQRITSLSHQRNTEDGEIYSVFNVNPEPTITIKSSAAPEPMEDEEDELLRVTQRFSQTPNRVRHKPSHDESRLSQDSTLSQNSTPITDGDKLRTSFANALSQSPVDECSQDSQRSSSKHTPNPFKMKSDRAKHNTIDNLHKILNQEDQRQKELKTKRQETSSSHTANKMKQTKLFGKPESVTKHEMEKRMDDHVEANNENTKQTTTKKRSAFDIYVTEKFPESNGSKEKTAAALESFKQLDKEEKKEYMQKSKQWNSQLEENQSTQSSKRKLEATEPSQENKRPFTTSDSTRNKLAAFSAVSNK